MTDADTRPVEPTAALAGTVAVALAVALGLAIDGPLPVAAGVTGALLVAAGVWALDGETNARVAVGSGGLVLGTLALGAATLLAAGSYALPVHLLCWWAVLCVVVDAATGITATEALGTALRESGNALLVGVVVAALLNLNAEFNVLPAVAVMTLAVAVADPFGAFVSLQLAVLGTSWLLSKVTPVLDDWLPAEGPARNGTLRTLDEASTVPREVPKTVWALVAAECVLLLVPAVRALFATFLDGLPVLGQVLRVLLSGPLHVLVATIAVALCTVLLADVARYWVADWLGESPAETLALQAGGLFTTAVVLVGTAVATALGASLFGAPTTGMSAVVGPAAVVLCSVVAALLVVGLALQSANLLAAYGVLSSSTAGFSLGSALLFGATLWAAELGVGTPLVVGGVAASLLVWDLGSHASGIGATLGRAAESTDSQFVHATGSVLVLAVAVGVAVAARYLLVPALAPPATQAAAWRSVVALGLVLVAILAFAAASALRGGRPSGE
ncbi:DUF7519 family protein [Haloarcula marina]|uniref:DUF7519 family protein n=1 Tax=Haloarcula marina TaxID=2961574 RepID=UPI0020B7E0AB|nr:hypothetical protein [Halomicroarcula marina]